MKPRRWGRLSEISHKPEVDSKEYKALPNRLKHLVAWRADHAIATHKQVRRFARSQNVRPSSNLSLTQKKLFIKRR